MLVLVRLQFIRFGCFAEGLNGRDAASDRLISFQTRFESHNKRQEAELSRLGLSVGGQNVTNVPGCGSQGDATMSEDWTTGVGATSERASGSWGLALLGLGNRSRCQIVRGPLKGEASEPELLTAARKRFIAKMGDEICDL